MEKFEDRFNLSKNDLEQLYNKHGSLRSIANNFGVSHGCISAAFKRLLVNFDKDNKSRLPVNENYFDNYNDAQVLYCLGFLMAYGCVYKTYLKLAF